MKVLIQITWRVASAALACLLVSAVCAWTQGLAPTPLRPAEGARSARVALVIGNSAYQHAAPVKTAVDDAAALSVSLSRLGFAVTELANADYDKTRRALISFGDTARRADIAIIYFAGHGLELDGENWLVPVDTQLRTDTDVEIGTTALRSLLASVSGAKELGLVILDACRGNPFAATMQTARRTRAMERGLARIEPEENILVAFAARPGTTALDTPGPHSAFTEALLNNIEEQGLEISYLFRNVHDDVLEATGEAQEPAYYGSLSENEIYLRPPAVVSAKFEVMATPVPASSPTSEEITWFFLRESTDPAPVRLFMERFPNGLHRAEARALISSLEKTPLAPQPAPGQTADQIAWAMLRQSPNGPAMRRFLDGFPDSPHAEEARTLIASLQAEANATPAEAAHPEEKEKKPVVRHISHNDPNVEEAWHVIRTTRDPNVLKKFAAELPSRQYASAVNARLAELGYDFAPPRQMLPREAAEYSVTQCDRLAGLEVDFVHLNRDAVDACRRALAFHPDVPRLEFQLCRCLFKLKQHDQASEHCNAAVQLADATGDHDAANFFRANKTALQVAVAAPVNAQGANALLGPNAIQGTNRIPPGPGAPGGTTPQSVTPGDPQGAQLNTPTDPKQVHVGALKADLKAADNNLHALHVQLTNEQSKAAKLTIQKQITTLKAEKVSIESQLKALSVNKKDALTTINNVDAKNGGLKKIQLTHTGPITVKSNATGNSIHATTNPTGNTIKTTTATVTTLSPNVKTDAETIKTHIQTNTGRLKINTPTVNTPTVKNTVQTVKVTIPTVKVNSPSVKTPTVKVPAINVPKIKLP